MAFRHRNVRNIGAGATVASRKLREESTPAERALWQSLKNRRLDGLKFRRQQAMGPFILDFVCAENRLVIELDGSHHHLDPEQAGYDAARTAQLEDYGYSVIRFTNHDVLNNHDQVLEEIRLTCKQLIPRTPSPSIGRGLG